jgi:hypothetical protein
MRMRDPEKGEQRSKNEGKNDTFTKRILTMRRLAKRTDILKSI